MFSISTLLANPLQLSIEKERRRVSMSQTITLTLPDGFFQPIQRTAQATNMPVEQVVLHALQASLPSLEGLPDDLVENLIALEMFDDQSLWEVMRETVPTQLQKEINRLLEQQQATPLTVSESEQLAALQKQADLVMLRKARAAVLLRFRGKRIPTLAEIDQLSASST